MGRNTVYPICNYLFIVPDYYNSYMNKIMILLLNLPRSCPIIIDTLMGKVSKITDGDTVHVLQNNHQKEKLLAEIDALERRQLYGNKDKQYLASLFGNEVVTKEHE